MSVLVTNNAWGLLSIPITAQSKQILLSGGQGERFPSAIEGVSYFYATIVDSRNNIEIVKCTARQADTLTVIRGADNTEPLAFAEGSRIEVRPCAALLNDKVSLDQLEDALEEVKTDLRGEDDRTYELIQSDIKSAKEEMSKYTDDKVYKLPTKEDLKEGYMPLTGGEMTNTLKITPSDDSPAIEISSTKGNGISLSGGDIDVKVYEDKAKNKRYGGNINAGGNISAVGGLTVGGTTTLTGTVTGEDGIFGKFFQVTSDVRKKTNVRQFLPNEGLALVSAISPVWFDWAADGHHDVGLVAQEVQKVVPEVVRVGADGYLTINYPALVAVAFAAIRDLQNEIKELKCLVR